MISKTKTKESNAKSGWARPTQLRKWVGFLAHMAHTVPPPLRIAQHGIATIVTQQWQIAGTHRENFTNVNKWRSQWKSAIALGKKYYKVTWTSIVENRAFSLIQLDVRILRVRYIIKDNRHTMEQGQPAIVLAIQTPPNELQWNSALTQWKRRAKSDCACKVKPMRIASVWRNDFESGWASPGTHTRWSVSDKLNKNKRK